MDKRGFNPPPIDLSQHERTTETVAAQAKCKLKKKATANLYGTISRCEKKERRRTQSVREVKGWKVGNKVIAARRIDGGLQHAFNTRFESTNVAKTRCFTCTLLG